MPRLKVYDTALSSWVYADNAVSKKDNSIHMTLDYDNVISLPSMTSGTVIYTAPSDGVLCLIVNQSVREDTNILVNGVIAGSYAFPSSSSSIFTTTIEITLSKGDAVTSSVDLSSTNYISENSRFIPFKRKLVANNDIISDLVGSMSNLPDPTSSVTENIKNVADDVNAAEQDIADIKSDLTEIGTVYSATWTATSTSAINTQLTNKISVPKGIYIITASTPYSDTTGNFCLTVASTGGIQAYGGFESAFIGNSQSKTSFIMACLSETNELYLRSGQSTSSSWSSSYLARGGIAAIRIA